VLANEYVGLPYRSALVFSCYRRTPMLGTPSFGHSKQSEESIHSLNLDCNLRRLSWGLNGKNEKNNHRLQDKKNFFWDIGIDGKTAVIQ
jgi:hypothetical protein